MLTFFKFLIQMQVLSQMKQRIVANIENLRLAKYLLCIFKSKHLLD